MRIGVLADIHDHLDHLRWAVAEFNRRECELVLFAGDFVSTFTLPPLRKLNCHMIACFGDNEGNQRGIYGGMRIIGEIGEPPFGFCTKDGVKILLTHQYELLPNDLQDAQVIIFAHTHKPCIKHDAEGRLLLNPGETSGWTYRKPSIAILETNPLSAEIVFLPQMPPVGVFN